MLLSVWTLTIFKNYSFLDDVIKTAALGKGYILGLKNVAGSDYLALKKYGVTIVEKSITINDEEHDKYDEVHDEHDEEHDEHDEEYDEYD